MSFGLPFQSTPLIRGATLEAHGVLDAVVNFNPRPSYEERPVIDGETNTRRMAFQSTPLIRGATLTASPLAAVTCNFNPRPSYEERHHRSSAPRRYDEISIHAPHTRSDRAATTQPRGIHDFNPRPSYEERRPGPRNSLTGFAYFNPRPSYEERRLPHVLYHVNGLFQSTPLIRGATTSRSSSRSRARFQSTPLIRGATRKADFLISGRRYFNPRPSYEERHKTSAFACTSRRFQSTPLIRGATMAVSTWVRLQAFQSTPLIRGATSASKTAP